MKKLYTTLVCLLLILGCKDDKDETLPLSAEKNILSFVFTLNDTPYSATISGTTISAQLPADTSLTTLTPTISISKGATISPNTGIAQDFSKEVSYTVTAENKSTKTYKVMVTKKEKDDGKDDDNDGKDDDNKGKDDDNNGNDNGTKSSKAEILAITFTNIDYPEDVTVLDKGETYIKLEVPEGTNIKALTSSITISERATIEPKSGATLDYSQGVRYTITAEDKTEKIFYVIVQEDSKPFWTTFKLLTENTEYLKGGDIVSIEVGKLKWRHKNIKAYIGTNNELGVETKIRNIDYNKKQIDVVLPNTYINGDYSITIKVSDGKKENEGYVSFPLNQGTPSFKIVLPESGKPRQRVLLPNEEFTAAVYINPNDKANYSFYLRKNGQDYSLIVKKIDTYYNTIRFETPKKPTTPLESGSDFQFVIKYQGKEYVYPFMIYVQIADIPTKLELDNYSLKKGEEFTVYGECVGIRYQDKHTPLPKLKLIKEDGSFKYIEALRFPEKGILSFYAPFKIPKDFESGKYKWTVTNFVGESAVVDKMITIEGATTPVAPSHLKVTKAEIVDKSAGFFSKQVYITFNEAIGNAKLKAIVFPNLKIENMITYKSAVTSSRLSDNDYNYLMNNLPKGYVLIEENGKEYQAEFSLVKGN
jgi:hypothetical protein